MDTAASMNRVGMAPARRRWPRLLMLLAIVLVGAVAALALWPVPKDFAGDDGTAGVAAGGEGLKRSFPAMVIPADNALTDPKTPERAALGRLLFFDPILSGANDISCATCHHPDLGFTDTRGLSMGKGARAWPDRAAARCQRGARTIWKAPPIITSFWDGRAAA